ncbi:MAG TPA: hypothetical protein VK483_16075 [Chitinophagaceae bacterium]|nr:hypothetical protein [Chitinophagaceae bacterium]
MKKIILVMAVVMFTASVQKTEAQFRFNLNFNIGTQPDWGPAGYDYAEYYYLPDIDVYYSVPQRQFVYFNNGRWVFSTSLPYRYRSYNLYNSYKVVINEPRPYMHADVYRAKYARYRGWNGRQTYNRNYDRYKTYRGRGYDRGNDNRGNH